MNFALFILLNAVLLIRPEELVPEIAGLRLYLIVIALCALTTVPGVMNQLSPRRLRERPITVCALGLLVAMTLSQVVHGRLDALGEQLPEFAKVVLYFLLLMAVVNTPQRLVAFVGWIVAFVVVLSSLGILEMHGYIDIPALAPIKQYTPEINPETGENVWFYRMVSSGIYNDPNDLCLILSTGILCCLCRSALAGSMLTRVAWLGPIVLFVYAMTLTHSRGGLVGLAAGALAFVYARYGARKLLPLTVLLVPAMLVVFGGRQMDFNMSGNDTSQERMRLWAEGLSLMLRGPVTLPFGIGTGQFEEEMGLVAHNSFVQAYVEMGLFGGALFLGMFYLGIKGMWRARQDGVLADDPLMHKLLPFVFAMLVAYAAGAYSVSRNYVVPTYLILGLAASFIAMTYYDETPAWFRFDQRMVKWLAVVGVIGLVFLKVFTQSMVQFGGG